MSGRCRSFWSDYDIYRSAPAILLGTIDKLALIGRHRSTINRIRGMFGLARLLDDNGLIEPPYYLNVSKAMEGRRTIAPSFSGGVEVFVDPVPSLIIQDEARLLEESLGTFAGLFETTLHQWFRSLRPILGDQMSGVPDGREDIRLPKVVCATATISNPERQIRVLYQKRVRQFPRKGTRLYRSFYANPSSFEGSGGECNDVLALFSKVSYVRSLVTLAGAVGNCRKLPNMLNERDRFQMSSLVVRLGLFLHARRSSSHQTTLTRTNSPRAFREKFEC